MLRDGNRIDLLNSGAEFFPALLAALASATREIFLETYIYAEDDTAGRVTDALAEAARRGVAVRVVLDGFGARDFPPRYRAQLADAGAEVLVYRPPLWWHPVRGLRRMHRKVAVIDSALAFVGGINIVDDWNTPDEVPPRYDYTVRIAGPLVADVADAAWHLWGVVSLATLHHRQPRTPHDTSPSSAGTMRARLLIRDNLRHRRDIEEAYLEAIRGARVSILLAIAYFLPSRTFFEALRDAAGRGVRVRILLQGPSDQPLMKRAAQFLYRRLIGAAIEVLEYRRSFLHTKVAVVDDRWATVGSSNLDPFSLLLSREANIEVCDGAFAMTLAASIEAAIAAGADRITATSLARSAWPVRLSQWLSYRFTRAVIDWLNLARKN
jgi:cardiolipin synthase